MARDNGCREDFYREMTVFNDAGDDLCFRGALSRETSSFDEVTGELSQLRLYDTDEGDQVFVFITSNGYEKQRRAYRVRVDNGIVWASNGRVTMPLPMIDLLETVRELCRFNEGSAEMEDIGCFHDYAQNG